MEKPTKDNLKDCINQKVSIAFSTSGETLEELQEKEKGKKDQIVVKCTAQEKRDIKTFCAKHGLKITDLFTWSVTRTIKDFNDGKIVIVLGSIHEYDKK